MSQQTKTPFETIESAHEFLTLLADTVVEAKRELEAQGQDVDPAFERRAEALRLALFTVTRLEFHLTRSRRILNDLRTLRRLLFEERNGTGSRQKAARAGNAGS